MIKQVSFLLIAVGIGMGGAAAFATSDQAAGASAKAGVANVSSKAIETRADKTQADAVVKQVTDQILILITEAQKNNLSKKKRVEALNELLTPVVSFGYIASKVMGKYGGQATTEQRKAFVSVFKQSLMDTYAKGMSGFVGQKVEVVPTPKDQLNKKKVNVLQTVKGVNGTNKVYYTMAINKKQEWQLINVILDGINLGKTFRMQFDRAVKTNKGDVGAAIQQWGQS